jgi:glutamine synthetase
MSSPVDCKFEYIWLDGYRPTAHLRSKTKVLALDNYDGELDSIPEWSFDGSSTGQAEGHSSDCLLKPVAVYPDRTRKNGYLVVAEVLHADGTPHSSNTRALIDDDDGYWFGFEQEYVLTSHEGRPIGFPVGGFPPPQGPYYCAVGSDFIAGRSIVEEHLDSCLDAGLGITGVNAEVMLGQWEYQCFGVGAKKACDDLTASRYLLNRVAEHNNVVVNLDPKPIQGDWNGSGLHTNFSNNHLRDVGGEDYVVALMESFRRNHEAHIRIYGDHNELRLTGAHETASIEEFSYGASDRGASIRIPISTLQNGWKGYLEDRRPASNADPYRVAARIIQTVKEAKVPAAVGATV